MLKYIQLKNYSSQEGIIPIYKIKGKESMWWDQFVISTYLWEEYYTLRLIPLVATKTLAYPFF
jgi:hypothetical protein